MRNEAFDFDGEYGAGYEALARRVIPGYTSLFAMVAALLDPVLPRRGRVLVVGAGTGVELVALSSARPDLRLHGVDPSRQMLDLAERRVSEAARTEPAAPASSDPAVTLQQGYVADVDPSARFDAATLINVLHFVPDAPGAEGKSALLQEIGKRVRPGGAFVLFDLHGDPGSEEHDVHMVAWRRYWTLMGMAPAELPAFDQRIRDGIHFASAERTTALALAAGFESPCRFYKSLLYGGWTFRRANRANATPVP